MVTFLLFFHVFLALANLTTWEFLSWNKIEYLKERKRKVSPFSRGIFKNFFEYCCEKFPPFKQWELSPGSTIK
jgi:palmitoyltransferase